MMKYFVVLSITVIVGVIAPSGGLPPNWKSRGKLGTRRPSVSPCFEKNVVLHNADSYDITRRETGESSLLGLTINECQNRCKEAELVTCTLAAYIPLETANKSRLVFRKNLFKPTSICTLYNAELDLSRANDERYILPVNCENEKKAIQQRASSHWVPLVTCIVEKSNNPEDRIKECSYTKRIGVSRSRSNAASTLTSTSGGISASAELGLTVGLEGGGPFGIAKASMETSLKQTVGGSASWSDVREEVFTTTDKEDDWTTVSIAGAVRPGETATMCQVVGRMDKFEIRSTLFKRCHSRGCECTK